MLREIYQENQRGDQEEPVAKAARELWQALSKTVRSAEWLEDDRVLQFRGKIYVLRNSDLRRWIVLLYYNTVRGPLTCDSGARSSPPERHCS